MVFPTTFALRPPHHPALHLSEGTHAGQPIYALSTLADFSLTAADPGLDRAAAAVLAHRPVAGALQSALNVAPVFGGMGEDSWSWALTTRLRCSMRCWR